jgi:cell division transport system permease protein
MTMGTTRNKAPSQRFRPGALLRAWLNQHLRACLFSIVQILKNPLGSLLTIGVIGVSLSLPAAFYLALGNIAQLTDHWGGGLEINLFLKQEVELDAARELVEKLTATTGIGAVELIDRETALKEYRENSGFADALAGLEDNPLPHVILVMPEDDLVASDRSQELLATLQGLPEVDSAQFDRQWALRLFSIIDIFRRGVYILATLLAFAVLLIIGNTIRLAIYNRRDEIEINQLFGATDAFIQRPFLYSGLIHGLAGSLMAWLLLGLAALLLENPVVRLSSLYNSDFRLIHLQPMETLLLIIIGSVLGLVGSWVAVKRHIRSIGLS